MTNIKDTDILYMQYALQEGQKAAEEGEVPVGCIITSADGKTIARASNQVEKLTDCTAHAEILAITIACSTINSKYLENCTMYVTLEPCIMCAGAIAWSRISRLVFGCRDVQKGFLSQIKVNTTLKKTSIAYPALEDSCSSLLKHFFLARRKK